MYLRCSPFLLANFIESTPLRNTVIMALPHHVGIRREREEALDGLSVIGQVQLLLLGQRSTVNAPNLDVSPTVIFGPHIQDILAAAYTQYCATDLFPSLHKLVANNGE
jgi:hypothetical protein